MAHAGRTAAGEVVPTQGETEQSTRRVKQVATAVDELVFHTHLQAHKALPRPKERGRRIAMLVGDIRALAQRTADAAREVKRLLDANAARVL